MMTEKQIEILKLTTVGVDIYDLSEENREILSYLSKNLKLCETPNLNETVFKTTERGRSVLADLKEKTDQKSKEDSDKRKEHRFELINTLIGVAAGYLIAKIPEIVSSICSLFK